MVVKGYGRNNVFRIVKMAGMSRKTVSKNPLNVSGHSDVQADREKSLSACPNRALNVRFATW